MDAFDTAWELVKQYTPNWKYKARSLPQLSLNEVVDLAPKEDFGLPSGQTMQYVAPHPHDSNFVVKVPRSVYANLTGQDREPWELDFDSESRWGDEYYGQNLIQELEYAGFPVVSEMKGSDAYLIQPRLDAEHPDFGINEKGRPRRGIADITLEHIIGDRVPSNYGIDQTGNWRMIDVDMGFSEPADYWPSSAENPGEKLQQDLDKFGIQLPASRLLNFMSNIDHDRFGMKNFLETLEPYSDNPNHVTIDGKAVWREGY